MTPPAPVRPRHVRACIHSPICEERWFVWWWSKDDPSTQHRVPYECGSWRCQACRRGEAAVTFARIKQAVATKPGNGWVFLVLTIDREGYFSGQPWSDVNAAYREIGKLTTKTLTRIGRRWGSETRVECGGRSKQPRTVRTLGKAWVAVVEAHRSGWPHVNLLVWCPELAAQLRWEHEERLEDPEVADAVELARDAWKRGEPVTPATRELARKATLVGGELRDVLLASGWGLQSTAEAARSTDAIAGYVVKLAGNHDSSIGEVAKITQAPLAAPERFRRLRAGKGFLPPRYKNETVTGVLFRRARDARGDWKIVGMNAPETPEAWEPVNAAFAAERALIAAEEHALTQGRVLCPLRRASNGADGKPSETRRALLSRELSQLDRLKELPAWQLARAAARARRARAACA